MRIYYLPGGIVNTLDGGLTAAFAPQDDSILVIGTAGEGVVNTPYQVTDRALAAQEFGFSGTLERGIEECATNSDNILAFRCGTKPMVLKGVGLDTTVGTATPGFAITFSDVTSDAGTRYQIWYKAGVLSVWKDGTLVYSNVANASVDTLLLI
jgi:membrane-bound inhibitor of C-type lysozyme